MALTSHQQDLMGAIGAFLVIGGMIACAVLADDSKNGARNV
jgi:hypothetical protein